MQEQLQADKKPVIKSGFDFAGNISNHLADTWDDLMSDYTKKLKLNQIEAGFKSEYEVRLNEVKKHNKVAIKKGLTLLIEPTDRYGKAGPPVPVPCRYNPLVLRDLAEHDPDVSSGIDAIAVNEGRVPWVLVPSRPIDTTTEKSGKINRKILGTDEIISDAQWAEIKAQENTIKSFIKNLCPGESFSDLRYNRVYDLNQIGNDFWQIIRNPKTRKVVAVKPIKDDATIRVCKEDAVTTPYEYKYFEGWDLKTIAMDWTFRRFVQSANSKRTYFKSFGDKRFLDSKTGVYYPSAAEAPEGAVDAVELWHFKLHGIDYGVPKWKPATFSIQTNRAAQLTDRETMNNSGVPKMIMVLLNCSDQSLETTIKKNIQKVKESGSKEMVMVVRLKPEAVGVGNLEQPVSTDFRIERLSNQQEKEGLYLQMRKDNRANIATTLRLPDLLFGRSADSMNRATAFIMMSTVEKQVFAPGRQSFDDWINDVIFPEMGFNYWKFSSQSGDLNDAELYIHVLRLFNEYGGITPNEMRNLGPELLDVELKQINEEWANKPRYISAMDTLVNDGSDGAGGPAGGVPDGSAPKAAGFEDVDMSTKANLLESLGLELNQADVFLYRPGHDV